MPLVLFLTALLAPEPRVFTLDEAIAYANEHQPDIRAALQQIKVEQGQSAVAMSRWYPTVVGGAELVASTVNQTSAAFMNIPNVDFNRIAGPPAVSKTNFQPYPATFVGGQVRQEAYDFGKYAAQAAVHDALAEAERANSKLVQLNIRFQVEEAFFGVLASKSIQKAAEDAYVRAKAHRDLADAGVKSGMRSPIELTRAEAELARLDSGRIRAAGGLQEARVGLATVIGAPELDVDTATAPPEQTTPPPLSQGLQMAADHHPELLRTKLQLQAEENNARAIRKEYLPDLYVQGLVYGYAGGAPPGPAPIPYGNGWIPSVMNYAVALVLRVPIIDIGVTRRAEVSDSQQRQLRSVVESERQHLDGAVRNAYVDRDLAEGVLPSLARGAAAAQANWSQADARFKAGVGNAVELADAEALRQDAEIQLAIGEFNLARARAALANAIAEDQ